MPPRLLHPHTHCEPLLAHAHPTVNCKEFVIRRTMGLDRRPLRSCGGNRCCETLGLSSFLFFTKEHSREYSCTAEGQRCHSHPPVSRKCSRSRTHRNAQAHKGNAVARAGNGQGSITRPPARDIAETRELLGDRVRLA